MYRVVLDTVVIMRGLINPHSICGILLSEYAGRYRAIFSDPTRKLLMTLPYFLIPLGPYTTIAHIDPRKVGLLFAHAEKVTFKPNTGQTIVVATAIAAKADYIICEDTVLLAIRANIAIPILSASEFIALLASAQPDQPIP